MTNGTNKLLKPGLFISHMDVVPVVPEEWNSDPFEPVIDDGFIQVSSGLFKKQVYLLFIR